jgi:hypothetical protein
VVKLASQDPEVRARVTLGYRSEVEFYRGAATTLELTGPCCYYCDIGDDGADFVLLLSDMARPCRPIRSRAADRPRRNWRCGR